MATMQELLFQKKFDKELAEREAEEELQEAKEKLTQDMRDIKVLEEWHISKIQARMLEWQSGAMRAGNSSPFEGEVLFCDEKKQEDQNMMESIASTRYCFVMLQKKELLIKSWYEGKHRLNNVHFRANQRGTMHYMRFGFYSADMEAQVRAQCLAGRHDFEAGIQLALSRVRTKLPAKLTVIVKQFLPDYIEHLKQEKELVQATLPW